MQHSDVQKLQLQNLFVSISLGKFIFHLYYCELRETVATEFVLLLTINGIGAQYFSFCKIAPNIVIKTYFLHLLHYYLFTYLMHALTVKYKIRKNTQETVATYFVLFLTVNDC